MRYSRLMIVSFASGETELIWTGLRSPRHFAGIGIAQ
jgi:hypothetical protein